MSENSMFRKIDYTNYKKKYDNPVQGISNKNMSEPIGIFLSILIVAALFLWIYYLLEIGVAPYSCPPGEKEARGFSTGGDYIIMCIKD